MAGELNNQFRAVDPTQAVTEYATEQNEAALQARQREFLVRFERQSGIPWELATNGLAYLREKDPAMAEAIDNTSYSEQKPTEGPSTTRMPEEPQK